MNQKLENEICQAVELILQKNKIQSRLEASVSNPCSKCGERAIKYAKARLDKINIKLAKHSSRSIRIARKRIASTSEE